MRRFVLLSSLALVALAARVFRAAIEVKSVEGRASARRAGYGNADAITEEEMKIYLYFLASDQLEGRNLPSRGYRHGGALRGEPPGGVGAEAGREHGEDGRSAAAVLHADGAGEQVGDSRGERRRRSRCRRAGGGRGGRGGGGGGGGARAARRRAAAADGARIRQGLDGRRPADAARRRCSRSM